MFRLKCVGYRDCFLFKCKLCLHNLRTYTVFISSYRAPIFPSENPVAVSSVGAQMCCCLPDRFPDQGLRISDMCKLVILNSSGTTVLLNIELSARRKVQKV